MLYRLLLEKKEVASYLNYRII